MGAAGAAAPAAAHVAHFGRHSPARQAAAQAPKLSITATPHTHTTYTITYTHADTLLTCLVAADDGGGTHGFSGAEVAYKVVVGQHAAHAKGQRQSDGKGKALGHSHHLQQGECGAEWSNSVEWLNNRMPLGRPHTP